PEKAGALAGPAQRSPGASRMDWYCLPMRFLSVFLLVASVAVAGCSGSSGASSDGDDDPPAALPDDPSDPPGDDDPPGDPGVEPKVSLSASDAVVAAGDTVTLTWSATNATSCTAS